MSHRWQSRAARAWGWPARGHGPAPAKTGQGHGGGILHWCPVLATGWVDMGLWLCEAVQWYCSNPSSKGEGWQAVLDGGWYMAESCGPASGGRTVLAWVTMTRMTTKIPDTVRPGFKHFPHSASYSNPTLAAAGATAAVFQMGALGLGEPRQLPYSDAWD